MSSIKNGYYQATEKLASGIRSLGEKARSCTEEIEKEVKNIQIESAEEFCLGFAMRHQDGNPLKGEDAIIMSHIMKKALDDEGDELFNNLKEAGFIHK
jgi:hypothetical protein